MSINGGASTSLNILCTNASSVNSSCLTVSTTAVNSLVPFTATTATVSGNLFTNNINTSSSTPLTLSIGSVALPSGTNSGAGLQIGWNGNVGTGNTDFINLSQGGTGSFQFGTVSNSLSYRALCAINPYANQGFWIFSNVGRLRIDDRNGGAFWWGQSMEGSQMLCSVNGISTSFTVGCGNSSGVGSTCLSVNTTSVTITPPLNTSSTITSTGIISAPSFTATNSGGTTNLWGLQTGVANISGTLSTANIIAQGTTTFNVNHPTTTLGNNISTNTTQYATVGFVNSNSGTALLASNNVWTGTNAFSATGNNMCISPPISSSMYNTTGSGNICLGGSSATLLTSGNGNTFLGGGCGQTITTGSNNTIIGSSAWSTGTANFSNCTVLGANAPPPVANNSIVIGSSSETIYVAGASQLNNSLLYGTTVCSSDVLQINNQTKRFHTSYTTGVTNTLTNPLPYMILFTPIAGMSFVLPVPSATNSGQTFILRKQAAGAGSVTFSCTGNPAVWVPLNSGTANTSLTITTIWQFTIYSTGSLYLTIA
ncbi:hypothetical protein EB001_16195 [bacterium]|nr:hypothetical protein [bacterium]